MSGEKVQDPTVTRVVLKMFMSRGFYKCPTVRTVLFTECHLSSDCNYLFTVLKKRLCGSCTYSLTTKKTTKRKRQHIEKTTKEKHTGGSQVWSLRKTPNLPVWHGFFLFLFSLKTFEATSIQTESKIHFSDSSQFFFFKTASHVFPAGTLVQILTLESLSYLPIKHGHETQGPGSGTPWYFEDRFANWI